MGSLMIEENVVAEAGTVHHLSLDEIRGAIRELGYMPRQRNVFYELLDETRALGDRGESRRYEQIALGTDRGRHRLKLIVPLRSSPATARRSADVATGILQDCSLPGLQI